MIVANLILKLQFSLLYKGNLLSALPLVQVEVLYSSRKDMDQTEHGALADLLLNWLRDQITDEKVPVRVHKCFSLNFFHIHWLIDDFCFSQVSTLSGRTHLLYIAGGGELKDCAALPPAHSDTPLIQDYRRMLLKRPPTKCKIYLNGKVLFSSLGTVMRKKSDSPPFTIYLGYIRTIRLYIFNY